MIPMHILDDLDAVIRLADALTFLGANNAHVDLTGEQCAVLIGVIHDKLKPISEQLRKELKASPQVR